MGNDDLSGFSMMDLFRTEAEGQTATLTAGLLALEQNPSDTSTLEPLMRAAHSIKGAARIVGVEPVVAVAHVMEDCFVAAQEGKLVFASEGIDVLLRTVDFIVRISSVGDSEIASWVAEHAEETGRLVGELEIVRQTGGAPVKKQPAPSSEKSSARRKKSRPDAVPAPAKNDASKDLSGFSLMDLFRTESETAAATLSEGLLELEREPEATAVLEQLMRAAHSIKGAARIVQIEPVVELAHVMEDCFVAAQEGKLKLRSDAVDVLLEAVDMISRISALDESQVSGWITSEKEGFEQVMSGLRAARLGESQPAGEEKTDLKKDAPAEAPSRSAPASEAPVARRAPAAPGAPAAKVETGTGREIRINSDNLNRLMALAGETLVEAGWLDPFAESLLRLKHRQGEVGDILDRFQISMEGFRLSEDGERDLREAHAVINDCMKILTEKLSEFETIARRSANLSSRLYREVISSRMRPFEDGVKGFPRLVRDVSKTLGKKVLLEIVGKETEVDRDILERLEAPLNHILRNALDHGIESPEQRVAAGKSPQGKITLEAQHRAGSLLITVVDDGRGADIARLKKKIAERNLATAEMAAKMTDPEVLEFLFLPGFSTASAITEISGRGVGLDVVQSMAQEVGGVIKVVTRPGEGMTLTLQLPLTRSVMRTLLVTVNSEPYAIPLARIDRAVLVPRSALELVENRQYFEFDGSNIGLVSAHQVLDLKHEMKTGEELAVVVLSDQFNRYGLVVEGFIGEHDLVVRPLDPRLGKVSEVSALAINQKGEPVLILDVDDIVRSIDNLLTGGRLRKVSGFAAGVEGKARKRILVVDDSITVREVERKLLENQGYQVEVAVDGMDGWNAIRSGHYDLVISDVDMPRMTGIELVTQIKKDPNFKQVPVVIVSYKDREEDRLRGLDAGANYYLTKSSFHDETLLGAVIDLIGHARS